MDSKLVKICYSPQGYWKGVSAIKKLAEAAKVPEDVVKQWLFKQPLWEIYLPAPRYVPRPKFDVATPNSVHQADLLFLLFLSPRRLSRARTLHRLCLCRSDSSKTFFSPGVGFHQTFKRVRVLIRVDALLQQQPTLAFFWNHSMHGRKLITPLHQLVKAAQQKIHAVDKSQISP